jgi:hypothetical protein
LCPLEGQWRQVQQVGMEVEVEVGPADCPQGRGSNRRGMMGREMSKRTTNEKSQSPLDKEN